MKFFQARKATYHTNARLMDEVIYTPYSYENSSPPTSSAQHIDEISYSLPKTGDLLGIPEFVQSYDKGAVLPNGTVAKNNLTWCEGYLLDTEGGRKTYEIARALQGTGKSLGFSIEGSINQRQGLGGKVIGKASVRHVAITHQPVNQGTSLEALVRSLRPKTVKATTVAPPDGNARTLVRQNLSRRITNLDAQL